MAVNPVQLYVPSGGMFGSVADPADDIEQFEQRRRENRKRLAEAMAQRRIDHPTQGLAQLAETALAGYDEWRARKDREDALKQATELFGQMYPQQSAAPGASPPPAQSASPPIGPASAPPAPIPPDIAQNFGVGSPQVADMGPSFGFGDVGMPSAPVPPPQVAAAPPPPPPQMPDTSPVPPPQPAMRAPAPPPTPIGMPGGPNGIISPEMERRIAGPIPPRQAIAEQLSRSSSSPVVNMPPTMKTAPVPNQVQRPQMPPLAMGQGPAMPPPMEAPQPQMALPPGGPAMPAPRPDLRSRALTAGMPSPEPMPMPPSPQPAMRPVDAGVAPPARPAGMMGLGARVMDEGITTSVPPVGEPAPPQQGQLTPAEIIDYSARHGAYGSLPREAIRGAVAHDSSYSNGRLSNPENLPQYNYVFDDKGIYRSRPQGSMAPHARQLNASTIGFAYRGGEGEPLSPEAQANGARLVRYLEQNYGIKPDTIKRHTDVQGGKHPREAEWLPKVLDMARGGQIPTNVAQPTPQDAPKAQGLIQLAQSGQGMTPELFKQMMTNPYTRGMAQQMLQQEIQNRYAKPKETDDIREYNFDVQQRRARGETNIPTFGEWDTQRRSASRTQITNDLRSESAFDKEAASAQAKRLNEAVDAGNKARVMQGDLMQLRELSGRIGNQGATADIKKAIGPYANALGIDVANLSDIEAFSSVISKLAPGMRPPGSGATSDFEFRQFLNSLPQMSQTPQGRQIILDQLDALSNYQAAVGDISDRVLNRELDRKQAQEEIRKLGNPLELWRNMNGQQAAPSPLAPSGAVDFLRKNPSPEMQRYFDQKYGQGAAQRALGGR